IPFRYRVVPTTYYHNMLLNTTIFIRSWFTWPLKNILLWLLTIRHCVEQPANNLYLFFHGQIQKPSHINPVIHGIFSFLDLFTQLDGFFPVRIIRIDFPHGFFDVLGDWIVCSAEEIVNGYIEHFSNFL